MLLSLPTLQEETKRFERKFLIDALSAREVEALIKSHPAVFREVYYEREVNNLYLDTYDYKNYWDNVSGSQRRAKVRLRWYDVRADEVIEPTLEIKIKDGFVGWKSSHRLAPLRLMKTSRAALLRAIGESVLLESMRVTLATREPALLNRYLRRYFVSADRQFRLTLDRELSYFQPGAGGAPGLESVRDRRHVILEIKYAADADTDAAAIAGAFPFRVTKSSKYVSGLASLGVVSS
ncbi:MAG TPA: VTC domain-containing protein [candidate division Zixibacteria bacterium]|nr:VTC domain-containing protein [candidate division Zixibacteria bacterium]